MLAEIVLLPRELRPEQLHDRTVVVFDVLRATSTMAAALAAGVKEIRISGDPASAAAARNAFPGDALLCGEIHALPPPGFDLGNSPGAFKPELHAGRTMFMSTTNGTVALLAARGGAAVFIGALVTAAATARAVAELGRDVTLLCSGTEGYVSMEDLLGCGAVLEALGRLRPIVVESDLNLIAQRAYAASKSDLLSALRQTRGGRNIARVKLTEDIDFCARLDALDIVGRAAGDPPVIRRIVSA